MANPTYQFSVLHSNMPNASTVYWRIVNGTGGNIAVDFPSRDSGTETTDGTRNSSIELEVEENATSGTRGYVLEVATNASYIGKQTHSFNVIDGTVIPANAPTVTPSTTTPTEGNTVTFTFGEAAGSAAQTYYFEIAHVTTVDADFTAVPPGNTPTARTTVTWDGSVFSPTSVAVTLAGAGGADGVDDGETFTGKLFDALGAGSEVATTATITVTDDPAAAVATVNATMDIYPMFSTNEYTFFARNSVFDSGNPTAARSEAMFMVEETGGSIIVKLAIAGQPAGVAIGRGGYEVNTSTTGSTLDYVATTGDPAADAESAEIFRIDTLPVTGWSVRYDADNINTFGAGTDLAGANAFDTADASGTGSTNISYVSNHTDVAAFYDQMTTSAQLITGGVRGQKAHYFGVTALAPANLSQASGAIGSYRLIFSRSGQTDISIDIICDIGAVADGS
tara:strand:- start:4487 stop:5839 length:1353 start_codon:yes stop_codon:yes gene_type:complete